MTTLSSTARLLASSTSVVRLLSVNVATPAFLGRHQGAPVASGIRKRPIAGQTVWLAAHNLAGDRQADLVNHGGPDKAVYAYPAEHLPRWTEELGADPPFGPGSFGENLTVGGWFEDEVRIGDVWAWGEARLQVAQPRYPCYKLALATGFPGVVKRLVANGRTGWYLRVLEPGRVPLTGEITVVERHPASVTVLLAHRARLGDCSPEELETAAACAALPGPFRAHLMERLASLTPPTPAAG